MSAAPTLPDGPLLTFYGDDFTGSSAVMEVTAFAGLPTVLFLESADAGATGPVRGPARHRHRRHRPLAEPGVDGPPSAPGLRTTAVARCADRTLQGLLHLQFRPACRVDRARDRHRSAHPGRRLAACRGGRPRHGPLSGLRIPVRGRQRRRLPARRAPGHGVPSGHADGRRQPRPAPGQADHQKDRSDRLRRHEATARRMPLSRAH